MLQFSSDVRFNESQNVLVKLQGIDIELYEELFNHARYHISLFIISDPKLK